MSVGLPVTKESLDANAGSIAYTLDRTINNAREMKSYLDRYSAPDLATMYGYTEQEAALLKTAYDEIAVVATAYESNSTFITQIIGLGDVS